MRCTGIRGCASGSAATPLGLEIASRSWTAPTAGPVRHSPAPILTPHAPVGTLNTPLHLAAFNGHTGCIKALVKARHLTAKHHIEIYDCRNQHGDSPLMMAAIRGHLGAVAALLNSHADPSLRNGEAPAALVQAAHEPCHPLL